ncbi:glucosaminidase domain-containing protein [Algibacillus agarilyticus]|uniref:glucosaminidase domain-containing protein n=1 Tax=Algibacillus agarilyticus TaxID=2234133 RepID=UPI000DCFE389|nr:glucosaminidase domain-containing protein [Algibacillus agarilyticus]
MNIKKLLLPLGLVLLLVIGTVYWFFSSEEEVVPLVLSPAKVAQTVRPLPTVTQVDMLKKLPKFSDIKDVKQKKATFFDTLYPIIFVENNHVLALRSKIIALQEQGLTNLSSSDEQFLQKTAAKYKIAETDINATLMTRLLRRVDFIPPALALTQAALESGWGSSRFSRQGNNLFGQWCFTKGCGMVPSSRDSDKSHEVAKFNTVNDAIRAYLHNLNTNTAYVDLRKIRETQRNAKKIPKGADLAQGLLRYSEEKHEYVVKITKFMRQNKLHNYQQIKL